MDVNETLVDQLVLKIGINKIESEKIVKGIYDSIIAIVKKREEQARTMIIKEGKFGDDFIGLLLKARYNPDENQRITVDDVIDECETFTLVDRKPLTLYLLIGIFYFWQCILIGKTARGSKKGTPAAIIWQTNNYKFSWPCETQNGTKEC